MGGFFYGIFKVIRDLALSATFVALAVALGFSLVHVPNVELVTLVIFMAGYILGSKSGFIVGIISMGLFTTLNPMGAPVLPVALAQVGGMAAIGAVGGAIQPWLDREFTWAKMALCGLACTLFYDIVTNIAMAISFGMAAKLLAVLLAGMMFSIIHMLSNLIIFTVIGPLIYKIRPRWTALDDS